MTKYLLVLFLISYLNILRAQKEIFTNQKEFFYSAIYLDSINKIHTQDTIILIATDIPWSQSPKRQKTMIWKYNINGNSKKELEMFSIGWDKVDSTGFIENTAKIFIHPPRHNQYSITEVAPFPQIIYPIELNKEYKSLNFIGSGWGDWSNLKMIYNYKIIGKTKITISNNTYDCWIIQSISESELGLSTLKFLFNEQVGFVKMSYSFYDNTKIELQLFKTK